MYILLIMNFLVPTSYSLHAEYFSISYIDHLCITCDYLVVFLPSATLISVVTAINISTQKLSPYIQGLSVIISLTNYGHEVIQRNQKMCAKAYGSIHKLRGTQQGLMIHLHRSQTIKYVSKDDTIEMNKPLMKSGFSPKWKCVLEHSILGNYCMTQKVCKCYNLY